MGVDLETLDMLCSLAVTAWMVVNFLFKHKKGKKNLGFWNKYLNGATWIQIMGIKQQSRSWSKGNWFFI